MNSQSFNGNKNLFKLSILTFALFFIEYYIYLGSFLPTENPNISVIYYGVYSLEPLNA